jgi:hypothetical protein
MRAESASDGGKVYVSSYTITIAADDPAHATTTLRVDVTDSAARISELLVRAGDGDGLTAGHIPAVDLDLLLRAVTPAAGAPAAIAAPPAGEPATPDDISGRFKGSAAAAPAVPPAAEASQPAADAPPPPPRNTTAARAPRQRRAETKPAARTATRAADGSTSHSRPTARKAATGTKAESAAAKPTKAPATAGGGKGSGAGRVYRRSPADLATVYEQVGSVTGVADHYGVPRHTAQGWLRTLRRNQESERAR